MTWAILTGEYPPQPGGVSDYTAQVAQQLANAGDEVHVWTPPAGLPDTTHSAANVGVHVHRLPDHFGVRGLAHLEHALRRLPEAPRILVQYVPHAFGLKAMNVPFCHWLGRVGRQFQVDAMFHEVAYPLAWRQPLRHNLLGGVNRLMALMVARASHRIFVAIPAWRDLLRPLVPRSRRIDWLPIPSNLPTEPASEEVLALRQRLLAPGRLLIGHFSTFNDYVCRTLGEILPALLKGEDRIAVVLGRGSREFGESMKAQYPNLSRKLLVAGTIAAREAAVHLAACDLVVQPYPDGVSCRRSTAMASLALGTPIVTSSGHLTEPLWAASGAVAMVAPAAPLLIQEAERVMASADLRQAMASRGKALYRDSFEISRTINALRGKPEIFAEATVAR